MLLDAVRAYWSDMPRAVRRLGRWWLLPTGTLTVVVACLVFGYVPSFAARPSMVSALTPSVVCFGPFFVAAAMVNRGLRRLKKQYAQAGGRLCTGCAHDLSGIGDTGVCPECGAAFDHQRDRERWARAGIGPRPDGTRRF